MININLNLEEMTHLDIALRMGLKQIPFRSKMYQNIQKFRLRLEKRIKEEKENGK